MAWKKKGANEWSQPSGKVGMAGKASLPSIPAMMPEGVEAAPAIMGMAKPKSPLSRKQKVAIVMKKKKVNK